MIFEVVYSAGPVYYWSETFGGRFIGLNEYGENTHHEATSSEVLHWLYDTYSPHLQLRPIDNPNFKTNPAKYPRLFIDGADWKYVYIEPGVGYRISNGEVGVTDCKHDIDYQSYFNAKEVFGEERQKYIDALVLLGIIKLENK